MVTDQLDHVIGVDTHSGEHALCLLEAATQRVLAETTVSADRRGYRATLRLAIRFAPGRRLWAIEGTGSYGKGLARFLQERGERVVEVARPLREGVGERGKSDRLDAERAARTALAGRAQGAPRQSETLQPLLAAREGAVAACTAARNELRAQLVTAPAVLRERLQQKHGQALLTACKSLRAERYQAAELAACAFALRSLARRIELLEREATTLERQLELRVRTLAPTLLEQFGIGPISAAAILAAWSHPGRLRNEAAFARLAGVAPIPASTGTTLRHRLDRGGDRRLNRALHTIILCRRRSDPNTKAYIQRRTAAGNSNRDATRCLKRYLARNLYRQLQATTQTTRQT